MMSISWLPIFIVKFLSSCLFPGEIDKIQKANLERIKNKEELSILSENKDKSLLI